MSAIQFLRQFVRRPASVGALSPSSRALAELLVEEAAIHNASSVIEFGPGTGAVTEAISDELSNDANFLAIEKNPIFCAPGLRHRLARVSAGIEHDRQGRVVRSVPTVRRVLVALLHGTSPSGLECVEQILLDGLHEHGGWPAPPDVACGPVAFCADPVVDVLRSHIQPLEIDFGVGLFEQDFVIFEDVRAVGTVHEYGLA